MRDADGQPNRLLGDRANSLADEKVRTLIDAGARAVEMVGLAVDMALSAGITTLHALEGGDTSDDQAVADLLAATLSLPRIGGCILLDGDVGPHTAAL